VKCSIIVPTINYQPEMLARCVQNIEATMRPTDELLVVENGTYAENCNDGAARANNKILVFVNDDIEIDEPTWLDHLTAPFTRPENGIVGCRLIYPDGQIQHSGVFFEAPDGILTAYNRTWDQPSGPVPAVTGACLAIRTDLFRELGGFDTGFRNGYEDVDLCLRAALHQKQVWYTADCTLVHHESQSGPKRWEHVNDNVERLQQLWTVR
jgi:GT2 family glycosyltransferase